jgi:hypothetical protein
MKYLGAMSSLNDPNYIPLPHHAKADPLSANLGSLSYRDMIQDTQDYCFSLIASQYPRNNSPQR